MFTSHKSHQGILDEDPRSTHPSCTCPDDLDVSLSWLGCPEEMLTLPAGYIQIFRKLAGISKKVLNQKHK